MQDPLVDVSDLHIRYRTGGGEVHAVRGVSLRVGVGESVGIVGESGSGKSTIARAIVGLVKPSEGLVAVDGEIVAGTASASFKRSNRWKVQMVFQDPYGSLDPLQTPMSAVSEAIRQWRPSPRRTAQAESLDLLKSVGISEKQARSGIRSLSGGQRQRVSIARALAPQPQVIVADEPTSSLDQSAQASILNLFRRIQEERGLAIIFISHDLGLVNHLTSRVHVMQEGVVVEQGATETVLSSPNHPYTQKLVASAF